MQTKKNFKMGHPAYILIYTYISQNQSILALGYILYYTILALLDGRILYLVDIGASLTSCMLSEYITKMNRLKFV